MKGCISYSLFGAERARQENCFDFPSYIRGFLVNIRLARLLYKDWDIMLQTDQPTYNAYKSLFDRLPIKLEVHQDNVPLTLAMLWRLRPCFYRQYTHVICRDVDSPLTFRERQAVQYWINREKAAHAITDSVSHNIPLMGGMIGFMPEHFMNRMGVDSWSKLINLKPNYAWERKGSDQSFLCDVVYPKFAQMGSDSITQHYVKGHANTFLSDCHNFIHDTEIDVDSKYRESNDICGHIGSAGCYTGVTERFLSKYRDQFEDLREIEKDYPDLCYWIKDGTY